MRIEEIVTEIELDESPPRNIRMFRVVDSKGRELFGPVEDRALCEQFVAEARR